jgi:hypothetical protein
MVEVARETRLGTRVLPSDGRNLPPVASISQFYHTLDLAKQAFASSYSIMFLPKLKLALVMCTVFFPVTAFPEGSPSPVDDLSANPTPEDHHEQRGLTMDIAAVEGEDPKALDTLPLTHGELHGRSLVRSAAGKIIAGNSTGAVEQAMVSTLRKLTSSELRTGGVSPAGSYYTYLSCGCFTGNTLGRSRICTGSSATSSCSSYMTAPYVSATVPTGKTYYFHCWCPSTSYLVTREAFALIEYGYGGEKYCSSSKKTKSAFSLTCSFTLY